MEKSVHPAEFQALKRAGRRGDRNTLCEVIMKTEVYYLTPHDSALNAARRMRERDVGFMPVCDNGGKILGTLTDRDLVLRLVADDLPAATAIEELMSPDPLCCGAQDVVARAQELMARNRKSRILCVDEAGRLEGIISLSDIAQMEDADASRTLQQISAREAHA